MKHLLPTEIRQVKAYLENSSLSYEEVRDDILDHICCQIEELLEEGNEFEQAFAVVQEDFSKEELSTIQSNTTYFLTIKRNTMLIKGIFITAYASVSLFVLGIGFSEFLHAISKDPEFAFFMKTVLQMGAVSIFCFGFLPMLFFYGYKRFMEKLVA